jgi:hypothetical protein
MHPSHRSILHVNSEMNHTKAMQWNESYKGDGMKCIAQSLCSETNCTKVTQWYKLHEGDTSTQIPWGCYKPYKGDIEACRVKVVNRDRAWRQYVKPAPHHINLIDGDTSTNCLRAAHRVNSSEGMIINKIIQTNRKTIGSNVEGTSRTIIVHLLSQQTQAQEAHKSFSTLRATTTE